jgi:NAD-dependent SIR2 family protein deacetylase
MNEKLREVYYYCNTCKNEYEKNDTETHENGVTEICPSCRLSLEIRYKRQITR